MSGLTILCVTADEDYAQPFVDEMLDLGDRLGAEVIIHDGRGAGAIENVLDVALRECQSGGYVLRLDDDERVSPRMEEWLASEMYVQCDHWAFPRLNLWPNESHYAVTPPLYPDLQTRLSLRELSGGRSHVHAGSPFGTGDVAPVAIEHHKFLVRTEAERRELLARYEAIQPGAGTEYAIFSVPEDFEIETAQV